MTLINGESSTLYSVLHYPAKDFSKIFLNSLHSLMVCIWHNLLLNLRLTLEFDSGIFLMLHANSKISQGKKIRRWFSNFLKNLLLHFFFLLYGTRVFEWERRGRHSHGKNLHGRVCINLCKWLLVIRLTE